MAREKTLNICREHLERSLTVLLITAAIGCAAGVPDHLPPPPTSAEAARAASSGRAFSAQKSSAVNADEQPRGSDGGRAEHLDAENHRGESSQRESDGKVKRAGGVIRGQNPGDGRSNALAPGSGDHWRYPLPASGSSPANNAARYPQTDNAAAYPRTAQAGARPAQPNQYPSTGSYPPAGSYPSTQRAAPPGGWYGSPPNGATVGQAPAPGYAPYPQTGPVPPQQIFTPDFPEFSPPTNFPDAMPPQVAAPGTPVPFDVFVEEARTGRFMFGAGVNSNAGVTGQIVIDERNFDITRIPTSFQDFVNGTAFRGAGQGFRLEAMPGSQVQRYLVSFSEPYLLYTPISLNLSGFFYDRRYFDWDEQRLGGRVALGYRLTHDLSISSALRMENVNISDPRVTGVQELDEVVGDNEFYSSRYTLTHDTRDVPFAPTEGHLIELSYEQAFGKFDYPRGELDYRKYFLVRERPDGSGRHTLAYTFQLGFSGAQTPIFEHYFAGGYSTLRGFDFRGASPVNRGVVVGGEFQFLGSVEYMFPLTADDMLKGVAFVDYGTVEEEIEINGDDYRVAPGLGLRISIPALGPAPLALDFAIPLAHEDTDDIQNFSFFFGLGRN